MNKSKNGPTCQCDTCKREIPLSAALSPEGKDYVHYFCGPACYEKWQTMETGGKNQK